MTALWSSRQSLTGSPDSGSTCIFSITRNDSRMALPRSVSPRGAEFSSIDSSALWRCARSFVSGNRALAVLRKATSEQRSSSSASMRSATSAFARLRRLGNTSPASIERETSIATTTLRLRAMRFSIVLPHWGRDAAKRTRKSPSRMHVVWTPAKGTCGTFSVSRVSAFSRRAFIRLQTKPATGTIATNISNTG